jgi:hypothetical protein
MAEWHEPKFDRKMLRANLEGTDDYWAHVPRRVVLALLDELERAGVTA